MLRSLMGRQERTLQKLIVQSEQSFGELRKQLDDWMVRQEEKICTNKSNQAEQELRQTAFGFGIKTLSEKVPPQDRKTMRKHMSTKRLSPMTYAHDMKASIDALQKKTKRSLAARPPSDDADKDRLRKCIKSTKFDHLSAFLLLSNAAFIGVQVEFMFEEVEPLWAKVTDYLFCLAFLVELVLRIVAYRCRPYFLGADSLELV